jgi:hypothetical protein
LLLGAAIIISGAVGRTELRPSGAAAFAGAGAGAALGAGAAAVGGPIEMAGIAGRLADVDPDRAEESGRAC